MKVHYFQRYHQAENVHTANAMLLLSRLYSHSPTKFFGFIREIAPEVGSAEVAFNMQEQAEGSVPDATIAQPSFKICIETKMTDKFVLMQLENHMKSFNSENHKILLTLSPGQMAVNFKERLVGRITELNNSVIHRHITFEELVNVITKLLDTHDYEMKSICDDYSEYCSYSNLIPDDLSWNRMNVHPVKPQNLEIGKELNIYYNNANRNFKRCDYIGLYNTRAVRAIGKITDIVDVKLKSDECESSSDIPITDDMLEFSSEDVTRDMKDRIRKSIERSNLRGYMVLEPHRFYFVDKFYETKYDRKSPGGVQNVRYFYLTDCLDTKNIPENTADIAERLKGKTWE